ncbi:MAG: hypothetical protein HOO06_13195 [Bdellovibrionaceae bacterium]|jgi:hypothetical protein|nr:hypothetical protein [Pseudobdellovibrionaceae bacterium]
MKYLLILLVILVPSANLFAKHWDLASQEIIAKMLEELGANKDNTSTHTLISSRPVNENTKMPLKNIVPAMSQDINFTKTKYEELIDEMIANGISYEESVEIGLSYSQFLSEHRKILKKNQLIFSNLLPVMQKLEISIQHWENDNILDFSISAADTTFSFVNWSLAMFIATSHRSDDSDLVLKQSLDATLNNVIDNHVSSNSVKQ